MDYLNYCVDLNDSKRKYVNIELELPILRIVTFDYIIDLIFVYYNFLQQSNGITLKGTISILTSPARICHRIGHVPLQYWYVLEHYNITKIFILTRKPIKRTYDCIMTLYNIDKHVGFYVGTSTASVYLYNSKNQYRKWTYLLRLETFTKIH